MGGADLGSARDLAKRSQTPPRQGSVRGLRVPTRSTPREACRLGPAYRDAGRRGQGCTTRVARLVTRKPALKTGHPFEGAPSACYGKKTPRKAECPPVDPPHSRE